MALEVFTKVVENLAFNKAARSLGMPTSTVSKIVKDLENHLGVSLLIRTTRQMLITQEGYEYYKGAVSVLTSLKSIDAEVSGKKILPEGHIRVDSQVGFATYLLIPELRSFYDLYPEITLGLGMSDTRADILGEGIDCVIRVGGGSMPGMVERKIMDLDFVTCVSASLVEKKGVPKRPEDIENLYPTISYFRSSSSVTLPLIFKKENEYFEIANNQFVANNGVGLLSMNLSGLGVGQHIKNFVSPHIQSGELIEILPDWTRPPMPLKIVYPPSQRKSARLQVFIEWFVATFAQQD
ncbi:LysR family transcriptional regulator [Salinicola rhizosphaerae]|uniref:LysR family transcriptional regulator n=1 Tax=Salinicola rhizosphaerae TaxID=1443141 RepID=A0ABQ3EDZ2_9GAMM|nr:LysR family transcriptional regulator [Salinicola rhizosphaerae]